MLINPPFLQDILCSIVYIDPQAHVVGKFAIDHSYLNLILSQNCCFVRSNPFSTIGSTSSQFDTPFSRFVSFSLFWSLVNDASKLSRIFLYRSSFSTFVYFLVLKLQMSWLYILDLGWWLSLLAVWWLSWNLYIQNLLFHERMVYSILRTVILLHNSISSLPEQIWPPVIAGMKYDSLLLKPLTNAACADCGSVSAIFDKSRSSGLIV